MKRKIKILIIASFLGVIALSVIQAYLINNTYKLEKDAFVEETKRTIFRFDDTIPEIENIYDVMGEFIVSKISDYKLGRLKKSELFKDISVTKDSLNERYVKLYQDEFKKRKLSHSIKFQKRLKAIVILQTPKNDTLYFESENENTQHFLGEIFSVKNAYKSNNSQTTTDLNRTYLDDNGKQQTLTLDFQVITEDYFNIDGWEKEVLKRMSGILALSIFIFTLVIALLYYAIKSLISQKKIADVKTDFINNITHELKTPLATLSLATKMLNKDNVKSQPKLVDSTVETIDRQNIRLQKLIDQVLNNSLGYQDISLRKDEVEINSYLNTVLDDFELSVTNKDVVVNRAIPQERKRIFLDKFYVTTALFNILENAVKYNESKVIINVSVAQDETLEIIINDNGIGISNKDINQIFEKFYRAGNKDEHNVKGLGLGLYYTNQIIKAHNGNITVESKEGQGTTFKILIPFS